jgi:hypothetical protein
MQPNKSMAKKPSKNKYKLGEPCTGQTSNSATRLAESDASTKYRSDTTIDSTSQAIGGRRLS